MHMNTVNCVNVNYVDIIDCYDHIHDHSSQRRGNEFPLHYVRILCVPP